MATDERFDPAIVIANPDEIVTSEGFIAWLDERQKGSPVTILISAADTLAAIREAGE